MEKLKKRKIAFYCLLVLVMLFTFNIPVLFCEDSEKELLENFQSSKPYIPLIPADVEFGDQFVKGEGDKIGEINQVKGNAYVIHSGQKIAYPLKKKNPLFVSDTLITLSDSRLNAVMHDKSVLALASQAKLTIVKSEYSWFGNKRSTVMNLVWGSARFIVQKLSGKPAFTVKTRTAVCGTRATDFIVSVTSTIEDKKVSTLDKLLDYFSFVQKAYALAPQKTITTVLTGPESTVGLTGNIGKTSIVGPASIAGALDGASATGARFVGGKTADAILRSVGPGLDSISSASINRSINPGSLIDSTSGSGREGSGSGSDSGSDSGGGGDNH